MDREARILFNAILMVDAGINRELAIKLATQMVDEEAKGEVDDE